MAAAASLKETVTDVAAAFERAHGIRVIQIFAGSNVLARQISEGAPIDVFISADEATIAKLEVAGDVGKATPLLTNELVVVVPKESARVMRSTTEILGFDRIAIGDPVAVPAGVYAKAWLDEVGLWERMGSKCIGCENVRAALATVEAGNTDAAIVYKTDAAISAKVRMVWTAPVTEAPAVVYPVAVCKNSKRPAEAERFVDFLKSEEAGKIFTTAGFGLAEK